MRNQNNRNFTTTEKIEITLALTPFWLLLVLSGLLAISECAK